MIVQETIVTAPSGREKRVLRLMVGLGLVAMAFFIYTLFHASNRGQGMLFVMLAATLVYSCLKLLHEWYHYYAIKLPAPKIADKTYTVDIFTTFCAGEPYDMLEQTLVAAQRINYPHITWCCDEENDPRVVELCRKYGARHVTRTEKKNAKAGNINNALQYAKGELMVVLDPDHVPAPGFLDKVVPHFNEPSVGFVQVVQAYYNHHDNLVAKGAAQQTYQFYGPMMMSMHAYGTVQAIGANCTFRRSAIDSIGGHAAGLAEDMNTAMHLHAKSWKSVYVPAIVTRGLVPATLSAYYKQQLKWSRGTFELLVTSYPKLFRKFTWRQKLHYFTLPFHYLCGLIFLLNFLIPVGSLFSGKIPLSMDIGAFLVAAFPLVWMTMLIRHYVQKWVAEETERGFHIVGGLLQIGTWWVHLMGLVYTIFRKKVPYIPTPKNDTERVPVRLHIPNIAIALISSLAIAYGLWFGLNPYTWFMAAVAGMNIFFMLFVIRIASGEPLFFSHLAPGRKLKELFWVMRHWVYAQLRRFAVFLAVGVLLSSVVWYSFLHKEDAGFESENIGVSGIYAGLEWKNGANVEVNTNVALVLLDVKFQEDGVVLPLEKMKRIVQKGAVPMLSLELPCGETFVNALLLGRYDTQLREMAGRLNGPVMFRLTGCDAKGDCIVPAAVWKYIHQLVRNEGKFDVVWVWKPLSYKDMAGYFPGNEYVDWLNVSFSEVQHGTEGDGKNDWQERYYQAYRETKAFSSGIPVIFSEMTPLRNDTFQFKNFLEHIRAAYPEVRCFILNGTEGEGIWARYQNLSRFSGYSATASESNKTIVAPAVWDNTLRGIRYDKGFHWFRNRHELSRREIVADFTDMKKLGIQTIMRSMPGVYDQALLQEINKLQMKLVPRRFSELMPADILIQSKMTAERDRVLDMVRTFKQERCILAWNLGQDILHTLENSLPAPESYYYRSVYANWLNNLCAEIRKIDSVRPLGIDVNWDARGAERIQFLKRNVPSLSSYFLIADSSYKIEIAQPLPPGAVWGALPPGYLKKNAPDIALFLPSWQDEETAGYLSLNGLIDLEGRKKKGYDLVANNWGPLPVGVDSLPLVKILKPAEAVEENYTLTYHALIKEGTKPWRFYEGTPARLEFEWFLVRTDFFGQYRYMKPLGKGSSVSVTIPPGHQRCRLYLRAILNGKVSEAISTLNIPLY